MVVTNQENALLQQRLAKSAFHCQTHTNPIPRRRGTRQSSWHCRTVPTCARKQLTIRISRRLTSTGIKEKHLNRNWLRLWSTIRNVVKVMRYVSAFIVRMRKTQFITGPTWQKGNNYGITISRNNVWQEFL